MRRTLNVGGVVGPLRGDETGQCDQYHRDRGDVLESPAALAEVFGFRDQSSERQRQGDDGHHQDRGLVRAHARSGVGPRTEGISRRATGDEGGDDDGVHDGGGDQQSARSVQNHGQTDGHHDHSRGSQGDALGAPVGRTARGHGQVQGTTGERETSDESANRRHGRSRGGRHGSILPVRRPFRDFGARVASLVTTR